MKKRDLPLIDINTTKNNKKKPGSWIIKVKDQPFRLLSNVIDEKVPTRGEPRCIQSNSRSVTSPKKTLKVTLSFED